MRTITTAIFLLYFCSVSAQSSGTKQYIRDRSFKKAIESARDFIDSLQTSQNIPGISICVGNREKILWAESYGFADLENNVPVNISSKFRLGSVSKVLTSLAVGRLYQQGKLDLDAPVQRYLPNFPEKQYSFTARQLAGHTAGIRHYRNNDPVATPRRYTSVMEALSIFSNDSLLFKPGTAYAYSTYGYSLLSAVLEAVAGGDFLTYMRDSIFVPLGMTNTFPDYSDSIVPGRVRFYEKSKSGLVNAALVDNSYKWAGGGFLSTPVDLVNMVRGLLNNRLLDKKTVEQLFASQQLENGTSTHVGIAWRINESKSGVKYIHHGGLIDGGRTFIFFYPESGYIFAITANISGASLNIDEAATILDYFLAN
jgi:serine beta-lactamase-like protein LACTB, mitochondrial